jgi:hypothetical protein
MISSAFLWGFLGDVLGRKKLLVCGYLLDGLCNICCALSQSYAAILVFKFAGGFMWVQIDDFAYPWPFNNCSLGWGFKSCCEMYFWSFHMKHSSVNWILALINWNDSFPVIFLVYLCGINLKRNEILNSVPRHDFSYKRIYKHIWSCLEPVEVSNTSLLRIFYHELLSKIQK